MGENTISRISFGLNQNGASRLGKNPQWNSGCRQVTASLGYAQTSHEPLLLPPAEAMHERKLAESIKARFGVIYRRGMSQSQSAGAEFQASVSTNPIRRAP